LETTILAAKIEDIIRQLFLNRSCVRSDVLMKRHNNFDQRRCSPIPEEPLLGVQLDAKHCHKLPSCSLHGSSSFVEPRLFHTFFVVSTFFWDVVFLLSSLMRQSKDALYGTTRSYSQRVRIRRLCAIDFTRHISQKKRKKQI